jgi:hypothetical protein
MLEQSTVHIFPNLKKKSKMGFERNQANHCEFVILIEMWIDHDHVITENFARTSMLSLQKISKI